MTATTKARAQNIFHSVVDPAEAIVWTPEYIESQSSLIGRVVKAGQMLMGSFQSTHLAEQLGVEPLRPDPVITQRSGIGKLAEYARPFRVVQQEIRKGATEAAALAKGSQRLDSLVGVDMQMAKIRQGQILLKAAGRKTYRREPGGDNPCPLCEIASTQIYYTDDLMPIHNNCQCDIIEDETDGDQEAADQDFSGIDDPTEQVDKISVLNEKDADASDYRKLIAVRDHGEIGPMLTWKDQHFMGPEDLPKPRGPFIRTPYGDKSRQYEMSLDEVKARNESQTERRRAKAAELREAIGKAEPKYAPGHNVNSPYAANVHKQVKQQAAAHIKRVRDVLSA